MISDFLVLSMESSRRRSVVSSFVNPETTSKFAMMFELLFRFCLTALVSAHGYVDNATIGGQVYEVSQASMTPEFPFLTPSKVLSTI